MVTREVWYDVFVVRTTDHTKGIPMETEVYTYKEMEALAKITYSTSHEQDMWEFQRQRISAKRELDEG